MSEHEGMKFPEEVFSQRKSRDRGACKPGKCDPTTGCPIPTEIACIKTKKVYEQCKETPVFAETVDLSAKITGTLEDAWCIGAELVIDDEHPFECQILPGGMVQVSYFWRFRFKWVEDCGTHVYESDIKGPEVRSVLLPRAGEALLKPQCEVFFQCLRCRVISETEVLCCIGHLIIYKLYAEVQLLVPSYGFCDEPEDCQQVGECPDDFDADWPPWLKNQDKE